ncbi:MAG: hypothetical protein OXU75_03170 [Deltaproteobacteria bacterium]|nr:hypothetical protein [Deltaproteobacteria bacterium]
MPFREVLRIVEQSSDSLEWPFAVDGATDDSLNVVTTWGNTPPGRQVFRVPERSGVAPLELRSGTSKVSGTLTGSVPRGSVLRIGNTLNVLKQPLTFGSDGGATFAPVWLRDNPVRIALDSQSGRRLIGALNGVGFDDPFLGAIDTLNAGIGQRLGAKASGPGDVPDFSPPEILGTIAESSMYSVMVCRPYNAQSPAATDRIAIHGLFLGFERLLNVDYVAPGTWLTTWSPVEIRVTFDNLTRGVDFACMEDRMSYSSLQAPVQLVAVPVGATAGREVWARLEDQTTAENVVDQGDESVTVNQVSAQWSVREEPDAFLPGSVVFDQFGFSWTLTGADFDPVDRVTRINAVREA